MVVRVRLQIVVALGLSLLGTTARPDESLGDLARREKTRREAAGAKPPRAFTNDDLTGRRDGAGTLSVTGAPSSPDASASPAPGKPPASADSRAEQERRWRERFAEARERLRAAESRAWQEVVEPVLVGGGGIGGVSGGAAVWVPMRVRKFVETEELRQARRELADLEEELRRSGGPPGWGRE